MARFRPLLLGPVLEAEDRATAERLAVVEHGEFLYRCVSQLELDQERRELDARQRNRRLRIMDSDE